MQKKKYYSILGLALFGFFFSFTINSYAAGERCCVDSLDPSAKFYGTLVNCDGQASCTGGVVFDCSCSALAQCVGKAYPSIKNTACSGNTTCASEKGTCKKGLCGDGEPSRGVLDCGEGSLCCISSATSSSTSNTSTSQNSTSQNSTSATSTQIDFPNPITSNSIDEVFTTLMGALSALVAIVAVVFIVIGGVLYMISAGDPDMIKRAKACWVSSVIGLAIVIAAPTFLKQVQVILGGNLTGGGIENALTVEQIAMNVLNFLLSIAGILAIISLVISGGMYMSAYGDETRIKSAKEIGKWAIWGIVVTLVSLIAVQQVSKLITG